MKSIKVFTISRGEEIGSISIENKKLIYRIDDKTWEEKIKDLAEKPIAYLKDEPVDGGEKTIRVFAEPGTEEHLRVLLFELRNIDLEGRINN